MNRPIPWKKYPIAAGTIFPISVSESDGWFSTVERSNCTNFASPCVCESVANLNERGLATSHDVGISGKKGHDQNALKERTKNRLRIGFGAPPHLPNADYAEGERERHEKRSDLVGGVVEIIEHWARSRLEGPRSVP